MNGHETRCYLVGGASRGLGLAIARTLADRGATVAMTARSASALAQAAEEIPGASIHPADLSDRTSIDALADAVLEQYGRLDGLVINSGGPKPGRTLDLDVDDWQHAFDALISGPLHLVRRLRPALRDGAAIVVVTSSSVRQLIPNLDASNVLRPAVAVLAKTLAAQLAPNVRVNCIAPGRFDTDRVRELDTKRAAAAGITLDEQRRRTADAVPLGRYGRPSELAAAAAFLLSPEASYINGTVVAVDGGLISAVP